MSVTRFGARLTGFHKKESEMMLEDLKKDLSDLLNHEREIRDSL